MEELLKDPNPSVIAAFLVLLRVKGETINEVYDLLQCACD
jgi:anthranilate phosphoribosyltransferase